MGSDKLTLTREELYSDAVEDRLKKAAAFKNARDSIARAASAPARPPVQRRNILYNQFVAMSLFGLIGGLLCWGCMAFAQYILPDAQAQAEVALKSRSDIQLQRTFRHITDSRAKNALRTLDEEYAENPFYALGTKTGISDADREVMTNNLVRHEKVLSLVINLSLYSVCGVILASCMGIAQSLGCGRYQTAIVLASIGSLSGLLAGAVALFGAAPLAGLVQWTARSATATTQTVIADALKWAVIGMLLSAAPGLVNFSRKRLALVLCGGLLGGAIGGSLLHPIALLTHKELVGLLVALVAIGCISGLAVALLENVAKRGWLKVVEGLIAGKQFILYRSPTVIGSFPGCEIYLFNDSGVSRHHAAIYVLPSSFEIEDLHTDRTLINGRPITRARLRNGDRIQIGKTCFVFHEKVADKPS